MKGFSGFKSSPAKSDKATKELLKEKFNSNNKATKKLAKQKFGKGIVEKGLKQIPKVASRFLNVAGVMLGSTKTATATQPGTGAHGGKKVKKYNPKTGTYN